MVPFRLSCNCSASAHHARRTFVRSLLCWTSRCCRRIGFFFPLQRSVPSAQRAPKRPSPATERRPFVKPAELTRRIRPVSTRSLECATVLHKAAPRAMRVDACRIAAVHGRMRRTGLIHRANVTPRGHACAIGLDICRRRQRPLRQPSRRASSLSRPQCRTGAGAELIGPIGFTWRCIARRFARQGFGDNARDPNSNSAHAPPPAATKTRRTSDYYAAEL